MEFKKLIRSIFMILIVMFTVPSFAFSANDTTNDNNIVETQDNSDVIIEDESEVEVEIEDESEVEVEIEDESEVEVEIEDESEVEDESELEVEIEDESELEIENESESEVEVEIEEKSNDLVAQSSGLGAKIRLLQLQKRIEFQIESADLIIDDLEARNSSVNTTRLNQIVNEFELLLEQIENTDFNKDANTLAKEFVATKAISIDLSKEFKNIVKPLIKESHKEELKLKIKVKNEERVKVKDKNIEKLKLEFNQKQLNQIANRLGVNATELAAKVESGELSAKDAAKQLVDKYQALSPEEKKDALIKLKEERVKLEIKVKEAKKDHEAKSQERRAELEAKAQERRAEFEAKSQERRAEFEAKSQERRAEFEAKRAEDLRKQAEKEAEDLEDNN